MANLAQRFETVWDKEQQKAKPSLVCHCASFEADVACSVTCRVCTTLIEGDAALLW